MAASAAASFADILAAESDYVMPTNDKDVQAALASFGTVFKKNSNDANVALRFFADILAAESDYVMPTNDKDVQAVFASFGVVFKKNSNDANFAVRADGSASTVIITANPAASFADILAAESDYVMLTNDKEVQAALASFGAVFKINRPTHPPPCAGRRSGRPGAAASRSGAILCLHRPIAVLLRAVLRARAVRPDRRR